MLTEARSVLEVRDLVCGFPGEGKAAVAGVSLTLQPGERVALLGPSGAGKTTLCRCILGLEAPTRGEVRVEGQVWSTLPRREQQRRRAWVQYVPQDAMAALDPQQTAAEHVAETLSVLVGRPREVAARQARHMLEQLGVGHRADALPRQMSAGEQRRVTLARVLALSPRLLVADEPTSGLDADRRADVLRDLFGTLSPRAACLWVTHEVAMARAWCTRAVVMMDGRIVDDLDWPDGEARHPWTRRMMDPWGEARGHA